ncbi:hypothetical protein GIB67_017936 [Kingdonia uniflora]|uniref:HAT C-terminal dimerisation domain-containing protein n=1 Tax=Kingdonia uniflora TaxID=39325 RepID=A0A7J7NEH1_9MAGN|nr:hypothetical protein GIB67_017936 [Kingdonia uniflora]
MLEKFETMSPIKEVRSKAKIITKFLYSRETVLKLVSKHVSERSLVNSSRIRSVRPSLTLENIVLEKENLQKMFGSSVWNTSIWASRADGKRVADLIEELSFWSEATKVLKATIPLVRALHLVNGGGSKPQMGYIYETMDQVKETIKEEFENKKVSYMPIWKIPDGIWKNIFHRPIHAASYFLNPSLSYYDDFVADAEVVGGLLCCIVCMVEDKKIQDLILQQLDKYREAKGPFGWINAVDQRSEIPPAKWWSLYGTCSGALRYGLLKNLSEELHKIGRNNIEQQRLLDITLVHHNLRLRDCESNAKEGDGNSDEMIDPMDDWIVDEAVTPQSSVDSIAWMDSNTIDNEEEPSMIQPKKEQQQ